MPAQLTLEVDAATETLTRQFGRDPDDSELAQYSPEIWPLSRMADAQRAMEAGQTTGKVVFTTAQEG